MWWRATLFALLAIFILAFLERSVLAADEKKTILGLFWRGCEESCEGLKAGLSEANINANLVIRDVQRDQSKISGFIEEAKSINADLVITFGTSVTLSTVGRLTDIGKPGYLRDIPVVFMIVADPVGSGIIKSLEKTGRTNVNGTYNRVPESVNIQAIRQFNPNFKKLGVLYNLNERNSVLKVEELRGLQENLGFELVALDLNHGLEAPPEIELIAKQMKALKKAEVDFIYVGSSSFLRRQHEIFTKEAIDNGIPVLSPYEELVRESNAILSVAARYYDVGRLAAKQVKRILIDGKKPSEIPVARISEFAYVINMQVARQLKLFPPLEFLQFAETIN